jgi:hypothetical protein
MMFRKLCFALILFTALAFLPAHAQDVLTYRNNNARTALDSGETILTPANVNVKTFGRLFTLLVDGKVDAQPLYLSAVTMVGGTHNILIVATEHGTVYAFDADTGVRYWQITTLKTGETTSDDRGCDQVTPEIGVTATPVILRPKGTNGVIYIVAMSKDTSGAYHQRLHALDAASGRELYKGPVGITGHYPGTGDNSVNGNVIFDPAQYKERSGLLLYNGTVYLTWASHCDVRPYTGWIMGYNAASLAQTSVLNITPNGNEGAVWGAGAGLTADSTGNLFLLDGNGVFDTTMTSTGLPASGDYGNSFLRIATTGHLAVADYWEMFDQQNENCCDTDLGSGGALLLPNMTDSKGKTWQLAAGAGKDGNLYIVNRASMGKYNPTSNAIYQELDGILSPGMWNNPAYFAGRLFFGPKDGAIVALQFQNAKLRPKAVAESLNTFGYPGATLSISSNNALNAILWATENTAPEVLHAYSPATLTELYNTTQALNGRDNFGDGNKFMTPTIANGKVYVGSSNSVGVFGILSTK